MAGAVEGRAQVFRRARWQTAAAVSGANVVGACVVALYALVLSPGERPEGFRVGEAIAIFAAYLAVTIPLGDFVSRRLGRHANAALADGRRLDARQRAALVAVPWRAALISLTAWAGAALTFAAYYLLRYDDPAAEVVRLVLYIVLGGLTTAALVFLLNELPLRPLYALAFRDDPPDRAEGIGVRLRLTLAWVLGAAVPLLVLPVAMLNLDPEQLDTLRRGVLALVVAALIVGLIITLRVARSVGEPLEVLRAAQERVRRGELDAEVAVDDVTEIGLLQAGFNEMVGGLRERAELEDLFGRHVGTDVAREALRRGVSLGGERREVSALFVDVVGSTGLAASRPPEDVVELMNAVFRAVVRTSAAEGGWVNKFEGDAALCVFGAPLEQPDHAARALRTARALRAALEALADEHPGCDAGIGVSSGEVVAGNVGAEDRYEFTVIGDPVNEAARLTEQAKLRPSRVLASGASVSHAGEEASHWRECAELELRGRPGTTVAYEPVAALKRAAAEADVGGGPAARARPAQP
jgi:adenylate cyclase